ncbi:MAG: hypothetical protein WB614_22285 [Pseudolabrys sp.]
MLRRKRTGRVERDDDIYFLGHQFCREFGQEIDLLFGGPKFERKILAFYITGLAQFFTQLSLKGHSIGIGVPYDKYTNPTYVGLLCTRTEWPHQPGDNAAKQ